MPTTSNTYARQLRRQIVSTIHDLGYRNGKWSGFILDPYNDIAHTVDVHFDKGAVQPMVEVQFGVSSPTLMRLAGFAEHAIQEDFISYVFWRLHTLLGMRADAIVQYPTSESTFRDLTTIIPDALIEGHKRSSKIRTVEDLLTQMDEEPSTCGVHPLMRKYLTQRYRGTLHEIPFTEWRRGQELS